MTMGTFRKCLRAGYRSCYVTSAFLARCARKIVRKTRRAKRFRRATRPTGPHPARSPTARPWPTFLRQPRPGNQRQASVLYKPPQIEAEERQTKAERSQIAAASAQSEAEFHQIEADFRQPEVVQECDAICISTDNLWQIRSGDFDSSDSDETDPDESDDSSDSDQEANPLGTDPADSGDSKDSDGDSDDSDGDSDDSNGDSDDSDSEDSTDPIDYNDPVDSDSDDESDDNHFQPIPSNFQDGGELRWCCSPEESDEDSQDSEEEEYWVKEKQETKVKGQLPHLYHHGNSWHGDDLSSEDDSDDDENDYNFTLPGSSPPFQPLGIKRVPEILPRTEFEPIAVLDAADFADPPDGQTVLGHGAFGEVTLKYQLSTGHWVAYKSLLNDGNHGDNRNNIVFEGQVMQLLRDHASFPKVYGVVLRDGHKALVSEFLGDELTARPLTLTAALHGGRPLELTQDEWCQIALDILDGVRYMHRCDLLHMDIKTDNILLIEGADRWHAHIIDFGVCRQSPVPLVLPLKVEESDTDTPLEGMEASKLHWTTCSDVYGVGETLRLIGQHKNIPLLEEGGAEAKRTSQWCSGYIEQPKILEMRAQLLKRGKRLPGVGY